MKVLVFGARGQLGRDLVALFGRHAPVSAYDLPELDIAEAEQTRSAIWEARPEVVINAAAYTAVDEAEDEPGAAFRTNEAGARYAAEAAASLGIPIVYYSTDYVFDGRKGTPYLPEDEPAPLGVYAHSKTAGELATREANAQHYIIRTAWLYGPGGNNFVEKILRAGADRPALRVVTDEVGSPTHTWDLAEATLVLARTRAWGTYHAVNAGTCSRHEFARAILGLAGLNTEVIPCASSEFTAKAPRPRYSVLSTAKLEAVSGHRMRPWQEALKHYMNRRERLG
jgi:dTDP-4-dehydrorhamnose reductase